MAKREVSSRKERRVGSSLIRRGPLKTKNYKSSSPKRNY